MRELDDLHGNICEKEKKEKRMSKQTKEIDPHLSSTLTLGGFLNGLQLVNVIVVVLVLVHQTVQHVLHLVLHPIGGGSLALAEQLRLQQLRPQLLQLNVVAFQAVAVSADAATLVRGSRHKGSLELGAARRRRSGR